MHDLATIRDLLAAPSADAIRQLRVYRQFEAPSLTRWQAALIEKLDGDADTPSDPTLVACMEEIGSGRFRGIAGSGIARLQVDLYQSDEPVAR
jgi:hypothetical protein